MQRQIPHLTRTDNPMERQIVYTVNPFDQRPHIFESFSPLSNQETFIPENEADALSGYSTIEKEDYYADIASKHMALRANTAPARPLTEIEEFRRSSDFLLLEHTVICASNLVQRTD